MSASARARKIPVQGRPAPLAVVRGQTREREHDIAEGRLLPRPQVKAREVAVVHEPLLLVAVDVRRHAVVHLPQQHAEAVDVCSLAQVAVALHLLHATGMCRGAGMRWCLGGHLCVPG